MSEMILYVVHDMVAEESGPIFEAKNDAIAYRNYQQLLRKMGPESDQDFKVFKVGTFDHESNLLTVYRNPVEVFIPPALNSADTFDIDDLRLANKDKEDKK